MFRKQARSDLKLRFFFLRWQESKANRFNVQIIKRFAIGYSGKVSKSPQLYNFFFWHKRDRNSKDINPDKFQKDNFKDCIAMKLKKYSQHLF